MEINVIRKVNYPQSMSSTLWFGIIIIITIIIIKIKIKK